MLKYYRVIAPKHTKGISRGIVYADNYASAISSAERMFYTARKAECNPIIYPLVIDIESMQSIGGAFTSPRYKKLGTYDWKGYHPNER